MPAAKTLLLLLLLPLQPPASRGQTTPSPAALTAAEDHQRLMDLLHITALRPGADHQPGSPNSVNYDESKANPYRHLPDPLLLPDGKRVLSAQQWWGLRRPQIVEFFDREIYGRVPAHTPKVRWEVVSSTNNSDEGVPALTKQLLGHVDNTSYPAITVDIELSLTTPANARGPVPIILEFSFEGYPGPSPAAKAAALPDPAAEPSWKRQLLAKGWGYAVLHPTSIQADDGAGLTRGIIGLVNKGQSRKLDDWGTIKAWAWGGSRAMDYFETDAAVDAHQVGVEGHSRFGKTALVAMAYDPRFAIAYISSSGAGGAQLYRRNFGERLENVAAPGEYHWMGGNFLKYAGPLTPDDLPVDAHELIALCAPRPVFIGAGTSVEGGKSDAWADARGMFLAAVAAGPVYRLLGKRDLGTSTYPPIETPLVSGDLAFRQHAGGHTPAPNWPAFLVFASRYLKAPAAHRGVYSTHPAVRPRETNSAPGSTP